MVIDAYERFLKARGIVSPRGRGTSAPYPAKPSAPYGFDEHPLADLQAFLTEFSAAHAGVEVDYIHGEGDLRALARGGWAGFLPRVIDKSELFAPCARTRLYCPARRSPMGEARDKRYYLEARALL